jgi:hypothetical protein
VNCKTLDYLPDQLVLDDPFEIDVDSMKLIWTESCITDFDRYEVHMSETPGIVPGSSTLFLSILNSTENTVEITGLSQKTTYYFCVRHIDTSGNYMDSNEVFGTTLDLDVPRIILTAPYNGEIDVAISEDIVVTFSKEMDIASVTFTCSPNPEGWSQSWSNGDKTVTYSHSPFESETSYQMYITNAQDSDGNTLVSGEKANPWTFTTGDFLSPIIDSIQPVHGAQNVALDSSLIITFSESMDKDSIVFTCSPDPGGWNAEWNDDKTQLTLTHNGLTSLTTYEFEITQGTDIAGNPLEAGSINNPFSFTTGDFIIPYVVATTPNSGESDVLVSTTVSITFSKEMDKQSVEDGLVCDFTYTASWNVNTLVLTPTSELEKSTTYTITISEEAIDLVGNQIQDAYTFSFTTEIPVHTNEAPVVDVYSPDQDTATDSFVILWDASDSDGDPLILNIYYDTDLDPDNGKALIIAHADNTGSYTWDIIEIPEGQYYIYITASDGVLEDGAYSGPLTISRPSDPSDDPDNDGVSNDVDMDDDGDGVLDSEDEFPLNPHESQDTDNDGIGNNEDTDDDGDGILDVVDPYPLKYEIEQRSNESFLWLLLWIIFAVLVIIILIGAMVYKNRKDRPVQVECKSCKSQFTPFDPSVSSVDCPECGESNQL